MLSLATDAFMLGVAVGFMLLVIAVAGAAYAFTRMRPAWRLFCAAWLGAMLLAFVLPLVLPVVIWPPAYFDDASDSADCASIAKDYASRTHPIARLWPSSAKVNECAGGGLSERDFRFDVDVVAHGPYGIPFSSANISNNNEELLTADGVMLGLIALMTGVFAVSIPFLAVLAHARIRRLRTAPA